MKALLSFKQGKKLILRYRRVKPFVQTSWKFLNSPFIIALVTGLLITIITHDYATLDARQKDLVDRRQKLTVALAEVQQRISYLQAADRLWKGRCDYTDASTQEWDIISGGGRYVPAYPNYKDVQLLVVMNDLEINSGIHDIRGGPATGMLGDLSVPSPRLAWAVRSRLSDLNQYAMMLSLFVSSGELPLPFGQIPDESLRLNFKLPGYTPKLEQQMDKAADEAHEKLNKDLDAKVNKTDHQIPCVEKSSIK